ncbi:MAG: tol-pal system protein YbgF [Rickettsiales bacterium]
MKPIYFTFSLLYAVTSGASAAWAQGYDASNNNAVAATLRLEEELRDMNGRVERMEHRIDVLETRLNQAPPAAPQAAPATPPPPVAAPAPPSAPSSYPNAGYTPEAAAQPPSPSPAVPQGAPENSPFGASSAPEGTLRPEELYDQALNALKNEDYPTSQNLFNRFLQTHKDHPLVSNAHYWLGESYYAEKNYSDAAVHFLNGYQSAPDAHKAPDNLLKLAMSLRYMKKRDEACATLGKLLDEFSSRPGTVISDAKKQQTDLACK